MQFYLTSTLMLEIQLRVGKQDDSVEFGVMYLKP